MEEGFTFMNPTKYKRWRVLLHRVIAKQQGKIDSSCVFTCSGQVQKGGER